MRLIFEWEEKKARANLRKHKVSIEEAKTLFADPLLFTFPDEFHSNIEERFISIGISTQNRILLIVHTELKDDEDRLVIRIISCRKATISERQKYEEET